MILMQTRLNFTMPDTTSAKFVTVAAFGHKNITRMKSVFQIFIRCYLDGSQTNETVLLPEFLEYLTASNVGRSYFDVTAIKTTNLACTSSSKVLAFTIPLPPIEEQIEIVSYIKKRSLELNKLIMKKELLVQELERYKKSLIYEVVTGKREV